LIFKTKKKKKIKIVVDNSFLNMPTTPFITNKPRIDDLEIRHKSECKEDYFIIIFKNKK